MNPIRLRRDFLKTMVAGGCALPLGGLLGKEGGPADRSRGRELDPLLPDFDRLTPEEKVRRIERVTHAARIHPSGIMVCMPYVAEEGLRVVRTSDLEGMDQFSFNFGHKFKAITDFFTNENSITASGSHLAAQSIRYQATGESAAMAAARAAYRSLRIVYGFGVEAGMSRRAYSPSMRLQPSDTCCWRPATSKPMRWFRRWSQRSEVVSCSCSACGRLASTPM